MAKILIIEDDSLLRELIARKLINSNYEICEAVDGEQGMEKIKEEKISLVLLDLVLPGIDGFEILNKIKVNPDPEISSIPVIILSNLGQKEDVQKGIDLGAADYLIKTHFVPSEIVEKIKSILKP